MKIPTYTLKSLRGLYPIHEYQFRLGGKYWEFRVAENEREACSYCAFKKQKACLNCVCLNYATTCRVQFYVCSIPKPEYKLSEEQKQLHREKVNAYQKEHPEGAKARYKRYREAHPDRVRERSAKYRAEHKETIKKKAHDYFEKHKDAYRERGRKWAKANPEKVREIQRKCYIRRKEKGAKNA